MISFNFDSFKFDSPGYLRCTLPGEVVKEVKRSIKKIDSGKIDLEDQRHNLAGHLQKETSFPVTKKLKYVVEALCYEYDSIFEVEYKDLYHHKFVDEFINRGYNFKYVLRSLWINYSKKHDFNPIHKHSGVYSFVLWVKIPYKLEDEDKVYPAVTTSNTSRFSFHYPATNRKNNIGNYEVDACEWDLIFFPASLHHSVQPFYTSDEERISISGNLFYEPVKVKKK